MKKIFFVIMFLSYTGLFAELTYVPRPKNSIWKAESLFIGFGLVVKDPSVNVMVIRKNSYPNVSGYVSFMSPIVYDSSVFLFHNEIEQFPSESTVVNIGKYPTGTSLVFKYTQTEAEHGDSFFVNRKLYTGQSREKDRYQSEAIDVGSGLIINRWAIGGRVKDDTCEVSFSSSIPGSYSEIHFYVTNAYREELDKYRVAKPVATPATMTSTSNVLVTLFSETVDSPNIYYTIDGSEPDSSKTLYNGPINISRTTNLRAIAIMYNDSQWIDSPVLSETYTIAATSIKKVTNTFKQKDNRIQSEVYNLYGQKISSSIGNPSNKCSAGLIVTKNLKKIVK
jgi:hypothetical protein